MNHNDAFSAMRLDIYKNFLRIHIKDNEAIIYAVGVDAVPKRNSWRANEAAAPGKSDEPVYLPPGPIAAHLIEKPIVVRV